MIEWIIEYAPWALAVLSFFGFVWAEVRKDSTFQLYCLIVLFGSLNMLYTVQCAGGGI